MPKITTEQRKIFDLLGATNDGLLSGEQVAAKQTVTALTELMALAELIEFNGVKLSSLFTRFGLRQIVNDDGLWQVVNVTDWIKFENQLGNAALALFLAAQARRLRLDRLARERAEIVAANGARDGR